MIFGRDVLDLDPSSESCQIVEMVRRSVLTDFRRRGAVIGVSGGVDSATVLALTNLALGQQRVLPLFLPEKESSPASEALARQATEQYGLKLVVDNITDALVALGCYERRDAAVRSVFPDFDPPSDRFKIVLPCDLLGRASLNVFSVVVIRRDGSEERKILPMPAYLEIVASSNMKQRVRMLKLYYYAERHNYAVVGTANKNEHDQGFFVKYGDGGADVQPIRHLYKTQVYQIARHLDVPDDILSRTPTTDTYSAECSQEEFYFRLPFELLDLIWYALEAGVPAALVAEELGLTERQVDCVFSDLMQKARSTAYLRANVATLLSKPDISKPVAQV